MATRWLARLAALVITAVVAIVCTVPAWAAPSDDQALRVVDQQKTANEIRLKVFSPAMHRELPVTLLLPDNYADGDSFPVLYALGGNDEGDDRVWVKNTDIKSAASRGALIVLPPTEKGGFFSDWYDGSRKWETFHTVELPALIHAKFKGGDKQALMGISIGGFAALKYAAHHPGQYAAAASFSGVLVSSTPGTTSLYEAAMKLTGHDPIDIWGDPIAQHAKWRYEDPSEQLDGLRGTNLFVSAAPGLPTLNGSSGDGTPLQRVAEITKSPTNAVHHGLAIGIEEPSFDTSLLFAQKASNAGLNLTTSFPLRGLHNWSQWNVQYKEAWSKVLAPSLGLPN
jgi:S-formylglutathione hydrolase FrmB